MNRDKLVEAFIAASGTAQILLLAANGRQPVRLAAHPNDHLRMIAAVHFRKAAHAELVNSFVVDELRASGIIRDDGWIDLPAAPVVERIGAIASELGAGIMPMDAIERAAAAVVDQVLEHVARAKNEGGLKEVNLRYKLYRQRQVAKGEKAINYSTHLANFTLSLVVAAAQHHA